MSIITDLDELSALDPAHADPTVIFDQLRKLQDSGNLHTMVPILPLLLQLNGEPYSLEHHFTFEELYRFAIPRQSTFITGRQVAKSTNLAAAGILRAVAIQNFKILYVTPLYEQIRRFSTNYVAPFINNSPVRSLFSGPNVRNSVLQRSFHNQSMMVFSYACLNADRIRGISADFIGFDEIQDMLSDLLGVIKEVMSHSRYGIAQFTGTPKTLDNTLTGLWKKSSMAEWFIPCQSCTTNEFPTWNIPTTEYHLIKMIDDREKVGGVPVGPHRAGLKCYKCDSPLRPELGRWVHRTDKLRWSNPGFHIPQTIMPIHYADMERWNILLAKMNGEIPTNVFYNEVLGEPYDIASKLVTMTELEAVSNLGPNTIEQARSLRKNYRMTVLAADWGGGGEKGISLTTVALLGLKSNGDIDVLWGKRLMTPHDHLLEAREIFEYWQIFRPSFFAHDYTGAGALRETFLIQAGMPLRQVMPCQYVRAASKTPCYFVRATPEHPRNHFRVDKSRTLLLTCGMIKQKKMRFFNWDWISHDRKGIISDFLSLIEEKTQTMAAGELYRIDKTEDGIDDFAQAVNIGSVALWHFGKSWPNLAMPSKALLSEEQVKNLDPRNAFANPREVGVPGND